jgi:hypothetical protein
MVEIELLGQNSSARLCNKRLNISRRRRDAKKASPHREAGQHIVDFSLREKPLCLGYFIDVPKAGLITGARLLRRGSGSRNLHRSVGRDAPRAV